ncbi:MAG: hypothetical protein FJ279_32815, partial [Planctomycetes bacterium]|nr:hypothetical protein [Planctomycetota bacterium]
AAQKAIAHVATGVVPYAIDVTPPIRAKLAEHYGPRDVGRAIGNYLTIVAGKSPKPLYASPDEFGDLVEDEFQVVWRTTHADRGYVHKHPLMKPTLEGYQFPDPNRPGRFDDVAKSLGKRNDVFVLGVAGDMWERANFMRGLDELLADLLLHPKFAHDLLERICQYNLQTLEAICRFLVDGLFISDDYGLQRSLMMSPKHWREFVKPRLAALIAAAHRHGLPTCLHSCGCIREIIPDLIEIGLKVLHPIQPEAMDVWELKREFGRDLCFFGGIGTQRLLRNATPQQVKDEVQRAKDVLGKDGGYILAPGITIQADCPIENVVALIEAAKS